VAEEEQTWSRDAEELAACFTVHARDLFGYACVLSDGNRLLAGDLVEATFEAAAAVWGTVGGLPGDECHDWLRDTLAAAAERRTGHPADRAFVSPSHQRLTELKMARFRSGYDAVAGLDRFAGWLRSAAASPPATSSPAGSADAGPGLAGAAHQPGARLAGRPGIRPAGLRALSNGASGNDSAAHRTNGTSVNGNESSGSPRGTEAASPPAGYGDPVRALYEQHYASLVRLAALLVRDTATAEQIVQDSFVAVAVAAAGRRHGGNDGALDFLRQSVLNRSRSALRHGVAPAPAAGECPSGSAPLLAALGQLPARQREVLVMRYYANLSEAQAADTIGISRAAVRRHATRANAALRTLLDAG
jgi:DNA-directed RNA polymerase specialized sigma24 family protein